ncbi:MAG: ABC transporter ATP-binding protein [Austwickia sp.]|nr:ABC transporter ATP-binding protein [Austwickia sp.]MBK9100060.1 ABC transporter ATP-binding protein [Austwickia sp.]
MSLALPTGPPGDGTAGTDGGPWGIEVRGATRSFGALRAVDGLDLVARPGEVTALVGPNGSGKTTLLLMLATLLTPDAGQLRVGGLDPVSRPRDVRRIMGWMPDGFGTWDALTVREVLLTIAAAYRLPAASRPGLVDELTRTLHLDDLADRPARVLSRGQKQRLGMARALIHSPSVLLLDEPASGLDPRSRIELRDVLRALATQGTTVLVSSHILTELEEMSDRAVVVAGGKTVATEDLRTRGTQAQWWRITSLDADALRQALHRRDLEYTVVPGPEGQWSTRGAVEVQLADELSAANLLDALVRDAVPVFGFTPGQGRLEAAYLAATQERR